MKTPVLAAARLAAALAIATSTLACRTMQGAKEDVAGAVSAVENTAEAVFTEHGAEAVLSGSIMVVDQRTRAVLRDMGMTITGADYDDNAKEREYEARNGDRVVKVELESRSAGTTEVDLTYRVGTNYDREQAREVLRRIQAKR